MKKILYLLVIMAGMFTYTSCNANDNKNTWLKFDANENNASIHVTIIWNPQKEKFSIKNNHTMELINRQCNQWGFSKSQLLEDKIEKCTHFNVLEGGCLRMDTIQNYKCIK